MRMILSNRLFQSQIHRSSPVTLCLVKRNKSFLKNFSSIFHSNYTHYPGKPQWTMFPFFCLKSPVWRQFTTLDSVSLNECPLLELVERTLLINVARRFYYVQLLCNWCMSINKSLFVLNVCNTNALKPLEFEIQYGLFQEDCI